MCRSNRHQKCFLHAIVLAVICENVEEISRDVCCLVSIELIFSASALTCQTCHKKVSASRCLHCVGACVYRVCVLWLSAVLCTVWCHAYCRAGNFVRFLFSLILSIDLINHLLKLNSEIRGACTSV